MHAELPDCAIKALEEKGFINGKYGDVPYEVLHSWTSQDNTQCYDITFDSKQVASVIVTPKAVTINIDLSGWLRGMSRDEIKMAQLMKGFKVGQMAALSAALQAPVRVNLDYKGLSRKLIVTDDIVDAAAQLFDKE